MNPASGTGASGTNYDQTDFGYDVMKRQNRVVTPGGTITRTVFNSRGLPISSWIGTNDTGATSTDPTGGGASGNNMVQVSGVEYDGNAAGGDGNVTTHTACVDSNSANNRVTTFTYDFRNRRTDTDGEIDFYEQVCYDNVDRVVRKDRRDTTAAGNLISRTVVRFDDRGAVYQTATYAVDPATGAIGNALTSNTWRDGAGNVIKSLPAGSSSFTKTVYDSLGRQTIQYTGYGTDATYADVQVVTNNVIMEQTETTYDAASNVIQAITRQRYHNASTSQLGALANPSTTPKARVTYAALYPDALGRNIAVADYGTNGGSALSRSSTIPARSDTCLVTSMQYGAPGDRTTMTDAGGMATCFQFDARGRETSRIMNCVTSSSSSSSSSSGGCASSDDINVTVQTSYNSDGNLASITAVNASTGNQTTTYTYGTTLSDSSIASSLLKRSETYPDSADANDKIFFAYNRQGQRSSVTDQGGTVHSYDYDKLGRQTQDRVTTLGSGVDGAIRRIATTFEVRGMIQNLTSYDNATVGSGAIANDCQFVYNSFSQLTTEYQSHSGAVNTMTTPKVQYGYANGSANTIRPTSMTYPNGRVLNYDYGTAGGINDAASRSAALIDSDGITHLADYAYLGAAIPPLNKGGPGGVLPTVSNPFTPNRTVEVDYTQPDIKYTLVGTAGGDDPDTGDIYRGFDRFSRVKDSYWYNYGTSTDVDRIKYGYSRSGNRTYRENTVATAAGKSFDESYFYDLIQRLKTMDRGTLNALKTAVTNKQFAQCWSLDSTGNWKGFRQDDTGDGTWDLV
ncbi:MAG: RHS repeat-associated core domain-containing protein, partial [Planctomycetales bacterium]